MLFGRPALWPLAALPGLLLAVLGGTALYAAVHWLKPWLVEQLPPPTSWYGEIGTALAAWTATALAAFAGLLAALISTPPLSAPALESLVAEVEADLGVAPREPLGFLREVWCGFRAMGAALFLSLPLFCAVFLIELFFPPAAFVTVPVKFLLGSLLLSWSLFDYPLTLRGIGVRARFAFLRGHLAAALGFGAAFSLVFWLACCGVILLPVGVIASTQLLYELLLASPASLPHLPRPAEPRRG